MPDGRGGPRDLITDRLPTLDGSILSHSALLNRLDARLSKGIERIVGIVACGTSSPRSTLRPLCVGRLRAGTKKNQQVGPARFPVEMDNRPSPSTAKNRPEFRVHRPHRPWVIGHHPQSVEEPPDKKRKKKPSVPLYACSCQGGSFL